MDRFNAWIRDHALDDIEVANKRFTWSNKRMEPTLVKLDKVLVNAEWNLGFLDTSAAALSATTSDHALIVVDFSREAPKSPFFRFENHWLHIPEVRNLITQSWERGTRQIASAATLLNFKLRRTRAAIRAWERKKSPMQDTLANCNHVVQYLDSVEERRHLSRLEASLRNHANSKAQQIILWQTSFWRRRAKIRGCTLGDENTNFFHAAANCQHRKNKIKLLVKDDTEFFRDQDKLQIATQFFTDIFGKQSVSMPTLDPRNLYDLADLSALEVPFTWAEIAEVI
ncbi:uncharacterized protein [Aegilops tauschii subsp. strangulata]|uniref:uncharacterized protein n=1 Tax=Aegilops tauschii subsp. strangulata TaxID=200361 RepID=UPI003CC86212